MYAIVIARRDFRESDQVITVYTKERGKCELVARGIKKITSKNAAHLEPSFFVDIHIHPGKQFDYIGSVQTVKGQLLNDLKKRMVMMYALGIFDRFVGIGNPDEKLFDFLRQWIMECISNTHVNGEFVDRYLLQLLAHLGVAPELSICSRCHTQDISLFSISSGGMVCGGCTGDDAAPFIFGSSRRQLVKFGEYHLDKKVFY